MTLYHQCEIDDLQAIVTEGLLPMSITGNNAWESKRAPNSADVVYLFDPIGEQNAFTQYGLALIEVDVDGAEKSVLADNDAGVGVYDEYTIDAVPPSNIVRIYLPEIFKDRLADLPKEVLEKVTWCKITGEIFDKYIPNPDNEYGFGGTSIYRQATDRDLEIIGAEAPIHIWSTTYFRAFVKRDGKHGCDELSLKKVVYDLETALEVERGVQKQPVQNAFTMSRKTMTQNAEQLRRDPVQHEKPEKHRGNEIS